MTSPARDAEAVARPWSFAIAAAVSFLLLGFVTLVVALRTRSWEGLEAVVTVAWVMAFVAFAAWVMLLAAAGAHRPRWRTAFVVTFAVTTIIAAVAAGDALWRAFVDHTAPARHAGLPVLFLASAALALTMGAQAGRRPDT